MNGCLKSLTWRLRGIRGSRGFSIIEVAIAGAVSTVIIGAIIATFSFVSKSTLAISNYASSHSKGCRALDLFNRDAHSATAVIGLANSPGSISFSLPRQFDSDGKVTSRATVTYHLSKGKIYRTENNGIKTTTTALADNVSTITVQVFDREAKATSKVADAKIVRLSFNAEYTSGGNLQTDKFTSPMILMRNKK